MAEGLSRSYRSSGLASRRPRGGRPLAEGDGLSEDLVRAIAAAHPLGLNERTLHSAFVDSGRQLPFLAALCGSIFSGCELGTVSTDLGVRRLDSTGLTQMDVHLEAGRLDILGEADLREIQVEATLVTYEYRNEAEALRDLTFRLDRSGDRAALVVDLDEEGAPRGWVDVVVRTPSNLRFDVVHGSGDASVREVAGLRMVDDSGDISIRNVDGPLVVNDTSGDLQIEGVFGKTSIVDGSGRLSLRYITGDLTVEDGSGDFEARDIEGETSIVDGTGNIIVEHATDVVRISDGSGDITLINAPNARVLRDSSGEVYWR